MIESDLVMTRTRMVYAHKSCKGTLAIEPELSRAALRHQQPTLTSEYLVARKPNGSRETADFR